MHKVKNVITTQKNGHLQTWASLKKACSELGFSYSTLSKKEFPFQWQGVEFKKTKLK